MTLFSGEHRSYVMRRLHSLTGVVPVGVFLIQHLWINAKALQGQRVYDDAVGEIRHLPYLFALEVLGIYLPLAFHALYGVALTMQGRPNVGRYPYPKNWSYTLQRVSGMVAFAFIVYHLWEFRIQVALGKMTADDYFPALCENLSSTTGAGIPLVAIAYLCGVGAAAYHFANGLYGFCFSWGITGSRQATRLASAVFGVLGIVLFVLGANTVLYFATGSRLDFSLEQGSGYASSAKVTCRETDSDSAATGGTAIR
jgi:succinate dehydrogenase/fumarate reductase cytochrome b subunit (b558 family)